MPGSKLESGVVSVTESVVRLEGAVHSHNCPKCFIVSGPCNCKSTYWQICAACQAGYQTMREMRWTGPGEMPTRTHVDDAGLDLYTWCPRAMCDSDEGYRAYASAAKWRISYKNPDGLCTPRNVESIAYRIEPGEFRDVDTGIAIQLPPGMWATILGRSSTIRIRGLMVPDGVIDTGFRGRLFVPVLNVGRETQIVKHGERIGQLIVLPNLTANIQLVRVDELETSDRGEKGFGSSGI